MATASSTLLFDDIFTIDSIDAEGRKFDRVSRLRARSKNYDMDLTLDYNNELFPLKSGQSFALALASSLQRSGASKSDGAGDDGEEKEQDVWRPDGKGRRGLEDDYHYVMYGKVYKFDGANTEIVTVYASYGGLLMSLTGSFRHLTSIVLGDPIYLLIRQ
ncbi:hypothetical protein EST38_g1057 [Candolleomyces aberdarensis]|uniref:DNA-directed RNA polymerases I, II, and III subunit RPABC3 n=1 Tax=Candolleomyces aberdarensis TaxID=2316362 RepID=A0A4Q2DZG1_9AGAR|nr:hypothetical protein EST38_g1057 [Candolleomyces aberdarensis]